MSDALVLEDVTKRYGAVTAVDGLSLRLGSGEVLGFLGPNGAGKTTTIRMVMSIIHPDQGRISILGHPDAAEVKDRIGYLPEERGLYSKMRVRSLLEFFGRLKGQDGAALKTRIGTLLEQVGLAGWGDKRVDALSKGMQQKLQFVTAILHDPELVILDEPFSGLDPLNRDLLETLMIELKRRGRSVVFSTHQMEHAERLCDRILLINRGRKLIDGTLAEVRGRFASRLVTVVGSGNFEALAEAPGVSAARFAPGEATLELADGVDPNGVVERALRLGRITRFEQRAPNLQEIYVRLVSSDGVRPAAAGVDA